MNEHQGPLLVSSIVGSSQLGHQGDKSPSSFSLHGSGSVDTFLRCALIWHCNSSESRATLHGKYGGPLFSSCSRVSHSVPCRHCYELLTSNCICITAPPPTELPKAPSLFISQPPPPTIQDNMLRTQVVKLTRAAPSIRRPFSVAAMRAAEGDTGAPRSGGVASGYARPTLHLLYSRENEEVTLTRLNDSDSWTKREQASETKWIREKEMER